MRRAMVEFPDDYLLTVSSVCLSSIISEKYETFTLVFTDGSKAADGTGFSVYVPGVRQIGYCLHEPSSVFTAEISALLDVLLLGNGQGLNLAFCSVLCQMEPRRDGQVCLFNHSS
jgi:hypothetical protein